MKLKVFGIFLSTILMTGCATFTMTPQTLENTLKKGNPELRITELNVVDKDGNKKVLKPTIHTSIRVTEKDDTRQQFYFITASLKDSLILGSKSVILYIPIKPIKISEVKKVEFDNR